MEKHDRYRRANHVDPLLRRRLEVPQRSGSCKEPVLSKAPVRTEQRMVMTTRLYRGLLPMRTRGISGYWAPCMVQAGSLNGGYEIRWPLETLAKNEVVSRKTRGMPIPCFRQVLHLTD